MLAFIALFGLASAISAALLWLTNQLASALQYLTYSITLPRWAVLLAVLLVVGLLGSLGRPLLLRRVFRSEATPPDPVPSSRQPLPRGYFQFWSVLWRPIFNLWSKTELRGPYCPVHMLEMRILREDGQFSFECDGAEQEGKHRIQRPSVKELLVPKERIYDFTELLLHDVEHRIEAAIRKASS